MMPSPRVWLLSLTLIWLLTIGAQARKTIENRVKSAVYLSPKLTMDSGSVTDKYFYDMEFPRGHIAIKSFTAELVDDGGTPIPLHETYMHHWTVVRYYLRQGAELPKGNVDFDQIQSLESTIVPGNSGVCNVFLPTFVLGSETRKTATYIPDPYGMEIGNPDEIPQGYEEQWQLNIHAIDTRGAEDKVGCIECRRSLYNITMDKYGRPFDPNYVGGFLCCHDETQCKLKNGFQNVRRSLYLRYTVEWVDWDKSMVPVEVYIFDVTDTLKKRDGSAGHHCQVNNLAPQNEYSVEPCSGGTARDRCVDTKRLILSAPSSGDIIYGVGHQHIGGIGATLHGEDGRLLCSSVPIYGEGNEAGNEAGYLVGMSTCYPQPGTVKITKGETIVVESSYSNAELHTGVMGFFYILVAPEPPASRLDSQSISSTQDHIESIISEYVWVQIMFGVVIAAAIAAGGVLAYRRVRSPNEDMYESLQLVTGK